MKLHNLCLLLALPAAWPACAKDCFNIFLDKSEYLAYEPLYLTLEYLPDRAPAGFHFGPLEDMAASEVLEIRGPDGPPYIYSPPIRRDLLRASGNTVEHSTLLMHRGRIITANPGKYFLRILDHEGAQISPSLAIDVVMPEEKADKQAYDVIRTDPIAYGMFMFMEGGDHIPNANAIVEKLAVSQSGYAPNARAVLALNYSFVSYDMIAGKVRRGIDRKRVSELFPDPLDKSSSYLKLQAASRVKAQFKANLPAGVEAKVAAMKSSFAGKKESRSRVFQSLAE